VDGYEKLTIIAQDPLVEVDDSINSAVPSCQPVSPQSKPAYPYSLPIQMACLPNGKRTPILKSVLTSVCERNCNYCGMRSGRDCRRVSFTPDEMARLIVELTAQKIIQGAFISSGIAGSGLRTQDRLIETAEVLRNKYRYQGYLHLKIMPGCEKSQVERGMQLADRVSVNLEAPNSLRLSLLAPQKLFFNELLEPLKWIEDIRQRSNPYRTWKGRWPSSTTQFVVGAAGESDLELLQTLEKLHQQFRLARGYFSGFTPLPRTPFENLPPVNPWRVNRLYQASFLLRDYGFSMEEMPFSTAGDLPLEIDPKLGWARNHLTHSPIEINRAEKEQLLRIPGIGPRGAYSILKARRQHHLRSLDDLRKLGIRANRAAPFILLDGRRPPVQLSLLT